jgi:uncharacterized protein (DUF885 family)
VTESGGAMPGQPEAAPDGAGRDGAGRDGAGRDGARRDGAGREGAALHAARLLGALGDEYFEIVHTIDPFTATQLGVAGFDHLVPDPGRDAAAAGARRIGSVESRLAGVDADLLDPAGRTNLTTLAHLAQAARTDLEHGLWEANASAAGYVSPAAMAFQSVPTAVLEDAAAVRGYLRRLAALAEFFDRAADRYSEASRAGRISTQVGLRQAIDQLAGHLAKDLAADPFVGVALPAGLDEDAIRQELASVVDAAVRPAVRRLLARLEAELPAGRPDDKVGIRFIPGGLEAYRAAVRRHTTTELTPEQIHQIGLDVLAELRPQWAELGQRVLGTADVPAILARLREDAALRFTESAQIVDAVTGALRRAEAARDDWFPPFDIPDCVIEEIDPVDAGNAPLAYYRPPAAGGLRPGAHCVLTADPQSRFSYEYEALSFHESTPGHHLQLASAQQIEDLPAFRRYLDAEVCGYVEGWGLYCERLADEMGLYSSDLHRLGMLSFDALRACRLIVDTGMHYYGWSRSQAVEFMWRNTATTRRNVVNEVDRYIAWPGQALAYMIGRQAIQRLRGQAERDLGRRFDIREFHGVVLGSGAVPLGVLGDLVGRWISAQPA